MCLRCRRIGVVCVTPSGPPVGRGSAGGCGRREGADSIIHVVGGVGACFLSSFLPFFLPSFLPCSFPSFLPSFLPSYTCPSVPPKNLPACLIYFMPDFLFFLPRVLGAWADPHAGHGFGDGLFPQGHAASGQEHARRVPQQGPRGQVPV